MRKFLIILLIVLMFSGCTQNTTTEPVKNSKVVVEQTTTDEKTTEQENIEYIPAEIVVKDDGCIYENKKCGYRITFPKEWEGWFNIYEFDSYNGKGTSAQIWFMAKSEAYSLGFKVNGYPMGLPMFDIVNGYEKETSPLDSVIYLGETKNDAFFSATGTSSPWGVPIYPEGKKLTQMEEQRLEELINRKDLNKIELEELDRLKVRDMSKDIKNILDSWTKLR